MSQGSSANPIWIVIVLAIAIGAPIAVWLTRPTSAGAPSPKATDADSDSQVEASDPNVKRIASGLLRSFTVAKQDAEQFGKLVKRVARQVGADEERLRKAVANMEADSPDAKTVQARMEALAKVASDAIDVAKDKTGRWVVTINRLAARRNKEDVGEGVSKWLSDLASGQSGSASQRFGIHFHRPANKANDPDTKKGKTTVPPGSEPGSPDSEPDQQPISERVVVLVHGLDDPGIIWDTLAPQLVKRGHTVGEFVYPNDGPIHDNAKRFAKALAALKSNGVKEVQVVAHSMGGLISRDLLTHPQLLAGRGDGHEQYPAVSQLIMVGTPNHGSHLAHLRGIGEISDQLYLMLSGDGLLFGSLMDGEGQAGTDLLPDSAFLKSLNARPVPKNVRLSIIAGRASPVTRQAVDTAGNTLGKTTKDKKSGDQFKLWVGQLVDGLGDGLVTLKSSKLKGVDDYTVVAGNHVNMLRAILPNEKPPAIPLIIERLESKQE